LGLLRRIHEVKEGIIGVIKGRKGRSCRIYRRKKVEVAGIIEGRKGRSCRIYRRKEKSDL
jgi:hypothetical protein